MYKFLVLFFILLLSSLSACEKNVPVAMPDAQTLTREANGYYCLMTVVYHKGPKGQIILTDNKVLWFTSVRDTIAFTLSPEEPKNIAAIYVNDMTGANWDNPGEDNWVDAKKAWYVLGSNKVGGMDAPETVPFGSEKGAQDFVAKNGGTVYTYNKIPAEYITGDTGN